MSQNLSLITQIQQALPIWDVPDPKYVWGVDTSFWSQVVDWQAAKAAGIQFAIVKALDGNTEDPFFEQNYKGVKDAGLLVGAYQWLYKANQLSNGGQARTFLSLLANHPVDLPPVVDFEWSPNGTAYNVDTGDLWGWSQPFVEGYGKNPMIYTAWGYWNQYGANDPAYASYPLMTAQYRVATPKMYAPFTQWKLWQFSANVQGTQFGFPTSGEKAIDFDYWCGTLADLKAWCGIAPVPVPTPGPSTYVVNKTIHVTVTTSDPDVNVTVEVEQ